MDTVFPVLFWLLAVGCALIYGVALVKKPPSVSRTAFKTLAIAFLALLALIEDVYLLAAALALCALGDALLAQSEKWLQAGIAAFAAGHVAYVVLFLINGGGFGPDIARMLAQVMIGLAAGTFLVWLWPSLGVMRGPVLGYFGIITVMTMVAIGLTNHLAWAGVGAVLFFASDGILGAEMFRLKPGAAARAATPYAVWGLYWGGQALITAAFLDRLG